jgi:uncharacterized protein DUF1269
MLYQALTELRQLDSQGQIKIAGAAGIIGGPVGMLLGGTYGALVGSLFDIDDIATTDSVLGEISNQIQPTRTAVLAHVTEQSPEVIDTAMARLGGQVMRRPVFEVEQEIAAAQEAEWNAEREARVAMTRSGAGSSPAPDGAAFPGRIEGCRRSAPLRHPRHAPSRSARRSEADPKHEVFLPSARRIAGLEPGSTAHAPAESPDTNFGPLLAFLL